MGEEQMSARKPVDTQNPGTGYLLCRLSTFLSFLVIVSLLTACAIPVVTGPYYQPVFKEKRGITWSYRRGDQVLLNFKSNGCFLRFSAGVKDGALEFFLYQYELAGCHIYIQNGSFVFEDMDTGSLQEINTVDRALTDWGAAQLPVSQPIDLSSMIPGFALVPASERRYVLSLNVESKFKGTLPIEAQVRLPAFEIGGRIYHLPPFTLIRYEKSGSGWWYVPSSVRKPVETKPAGRMLGGGYAVTKEPDVLYEEQSIFRVSTVFRGSNRPLDEKTTEGTGGPRLYGAVFFEVSGGHQVRLVGSEVKWRIGGDTEDHTLPIKEGDLRLKRYSTRDLSERLDQLLAFSGNERPQYKDRNPIFLIRIPNYQPKRFKVTLPRIEANGKEWSFKPLEFEYRSSGLDVEVWP